MGISSLFEIILIKPYILLHKVGPTPCKISAFIPPIPSAFWYIILMGDFKSKVGKEISNR
jgi:hypothetical protein